nr:glycosyltransferase [Motilibacter aurantiacus]
MIFRNAGQFLEDAAQSVLAQTYEHVELVLVDDGSTDGSGRHARDLAARHPQRVRVIEHPGGANLGMSASRNAGAADARGELLAFLDADDVWEPGHLTGEVALLQAAPGAQMVCGRAVVWHSWRPPAPGEQRRRDVPTPLPFAPGTVVDPPQLLAALMRRPEVRTPICSLLVRTDAFRAVGGSEPEFRGMFEDQVLLAKLQLRHRAVISGALTARYRRHPASATAAAASAGEYELRPGTARARFLQWLQRRVADEVGPGDLADAVAAAAAAVGPPARATRVRTAVRQRVPSPVRQQARRVVRPRRPGLVRLGSLRSTEPLSRWFGYDRGRSGEAGQPVDRVYIERFLAESALDIRGRVLEVGDPSYTRRFGGDRVRRADVLHVEAGNPEATFVADLTDAPELPSDAFDCIVLTQTLHLVYDMRAAVRTLHRVLAPGGTLLLTVPGITPLAADRWAQDWCWSLTPAAAERLVGEVFGDALVEVRAWGNVLAAVAQIEGMAASELRAEQLEPVDPQYPVIVAVRAFKGPAAAAAPAAVLGAEGPAA